MSYTSHYGSKQKKLVCACSIQSQMHLVSCKLGVALSCVGNLPVCCSSTRCLIGFALLGRLVFDVNMSGFDQPGMTKPHTAVLC